VPNEFLESYFPLRIETYETIPDSGGAGRNRGGNGLRIGYRLLEPGEVSIHDDRWLTYPWGVNGGLPGARSRKRLERKDGTEELLGSKVDRIRVEEGDLLIYETWGGGGCGDPLEREVERVHFDVEAGLVTPQGALNYGVVVGDDLAIDEAATEALRARLRAERGPVPLFDRGFTSIDELKARCLDETGLAPPQQPRFSHRALARTSVAATATTATTPRKRKAKAA
jgi:N-methylhydantoinase B